jgi:hypothetical protein
LADPAGPALTLRFVAGPDVDALDLPRSEILAAVEGAVRAQGEGNVVLEPGGTYGALQGWSERPLVMTQAEQAHITGSRDRRVFGGASGRWEVTLAPTPYRRV